MCTVLLVKKTSSPASQLHFNSGLIKLQGMQKKVTVYFKSRNEKGVWYKTERHRNGNVSCFCPGFVYNLKCWHVDRVKNYKVVNVAK